MEHFTYSISHKKREHNLSSKVSFHRPVALLLPHLATSAARALLNAVEARAFADAAFRTRDLRNQAPDNSPIVPWCLLARSKTWSRRSASDSASVKPSTASISSSRTLATSLSIPSPLDGCCCFLLSPTPSPVAVVLAASGPRNGNNLAGRRSLTTSAPCNRVARSITDAQNRPKQSSISSGGHNKRDAYPKPP